jgi:hypothetical protein
VGSSKSRRGEANHSHQCRGGDVAAYLRVREICMEQKKKCRSDRTKSRPLDLEGIRGRHPHTSAEEHLGEKSGWNVPNSRSPKL